MGQKRQSKPGDGANGTEVETQASDPHGRKRGEEGGGGDRGARVGGVRATTQVRRRADAESTNKDFKRFNAMTRGLKGEPH